MVLAAVLMLGLWGCAPAVERTQVNQEPAPTPEAIPFPNADIPPGEYAPWQVAYMDFLTSLCVEEFPTMELLRELSAEKKWDSPQWTENADQISTTYSLHDMDEDGVPELFVEFGVNSTTQIDCYTFQDNGLSFLGAFGPFHHVSAYLYSCPGENAVLLDTHAWDTRYSSIEKYVAESGQLVSQGEIFGEYIGVDPETQYSIYTPIEEVVPGTFILSQHAIRLGWLDSTPLLLPICDYGASTRQNPAPLPEEAVRSMIGNVLWAETPFLAVDGGFSNGTAEITLEEYLSLKTAYPAIPLTAKEYAWVDVNKDGQTDCILWIETPPDIHGHRFQYHMVFSVEDSSVYAYFLSNTEWDVTETGVFRRVNDPHRLSFWKGQCYDYPVQEPWQEPFLVPVPFTSTD